MFFEISVKWHAKSLSGHAIVVFVVLLAVLLSSELCPVVKTLATRDKARGSELAPKTNERLGAPQDVGFRFEQFSVHVLRELKLIGRTQLCSRPPRVLFLVAEPHACHCYTCQGRTWFQLFQSLDLISPLAVKCQRCLADRDLALTTIPCRATMLRPCSLQRLLALTNLSDLDFQAPMPKKPPIKEQGMSDVYDLRRQAQRPG